MPRSLIRSLALLSLVVFLPFGHAVAEDEEEGELPPESKYLEIEPAFVTNYGMSDRLRYMKVEVTLRVSGAEGETQINHHMPYIKDTLLSLFALQTPQSIGGAEGKETLRQESLKAVETILLEEDETSYIEDLLFTSFVAHR